MKAEPKIIPNIEKNSYSCGTMRYCSQFLNKQLNKRALGYEESQYYCLGIIDMWALKKKINASEKKWLTKIYVENETDSNGDTRYLIDRRGRILDYEGVDLNRLRTIERDELAAVLGMEDGNLMNSKEL